MLVFTRERDVC